MPHEVVGGQSPSTLAVVATLPQPAFRSACREGQLEEALPALPHELESRTDNDFNAAMCYYALGRLLQQPFEHLGAITELGDGEDAIRSHVLERYRQLVREGCPYIPKQLKDRVERPSLRRDLVKAMTWVCCAIELVDPLSRLFMGRLGGIKEAIELRKNTPHLIPNTATLARRAPAFFHLIQGLRHSHLADIEVAITPLRVQYSAPHDRQRRPPTHYAVTPRDVDAVISRVVAYFIDRFDRAKHGDVENLVPVTRWNAMPQAVRHLRLRSSRDLGVELLLRFERSRIPADLAEALLHSRQALNLNVELIDPVSFVTLACHVLLAGFRHHVDIPIDAARDTLSELACFVQRLPEQHPQRSQCLTAVGNAYLNCFQRFNHFAMLDEAVNMHWNAFTDHGSWDSQVAHATAMVDRCDLLQEPTDFDMAIDLCRAAAGIAEDKHDMHTQAILLSSCGNVLFSRFKSRLASEQSDLDAAIEAYRAAVQLSPESPQMLAALGQAYRVAFVESQYKSRHLIDAAFQVLKLATQHCEQHPNGGVDTDGPVLGIWMAIGDCYIARFESPYCHADDLPRALQMYDCTLGYMEEGDLRKLPVLNDIVAIRWLQACGSRSLPDAPLMPYSSALANHHSIINPIMRSLRTEPTADDWGGGTQQPKDLVQLVEASRKAVRAVGSLPNMLHAAQLHVQVCRLWRRALVNFGSRHPFEFCFVSEERYAFGQYMEIVPRRAWIGHSIFRRYTEMAALCDIVRSAVAWATVEKDDIALQWFEQGRSVVWSQIRILRSHALGFPGLSDGDARKLMTLSAEIEALGRRGDEQAPSRRRLAHEYEALLDRLRGHPEFGDFVRPILDHSKLSTICRSGPVVCVNVCKEKGLCAAIVLRDGEICGYVPLPCLSPSQAQTWRQQLYSAVRPPGSRVSGPVDLSVAVPDSRDVLRQLWHAVVQPILAHGLQMRTGTFWSTSVHLPHITWCTTGALSFLPLHAAGPYAEGLPNTDDLVVSSYTPNLASLVHRPESQMTSTILLVAQPSVDLYRPILETEQEVRDISSLFPGTCTLMGVGDLEATVDAVLTAMSSHAYVHLACHGTQDPRDPTSSGFILAGGHKLTLAKLMETPSDGRELAFLSACETAAGDEIVPDEAVHLAAGMLAAGYRSVVGTMWSISDTHAPQLALDFYKILLTQRDLSGQVDTDAARALHKAVAQMKENVGEDRFDLWAPFVHYGG